MKEIILQFTYDCILISVPSDIEKNIQSIRKKFDKWLYDKSNDHDYWVYVKGVKKAVSFDAEAFVRYLNEHHIVDQHKKAYIVDLNYKGTLSKLTTLYF